MSLFDACAIGIGALAVLFVCIAFERLMRPPDPPGVIRGRFGRYFSRAKLGVAMHGAAS
jgi:hypothetical protein